MQNERFDDGSMKELDIQSIDTGMGLERIGALLKVAMIITIRIL